jgi:4-hydroxyacetophenone monooxygenase
VPDVTPGPAVELGDEEVRAVLADAALVPLLPALAVATGDAALLSDRLRPDPGQVLDADGGLDEGALAEARAAAFGALVRLRDRGATGAVDDGVLRRGLAFLVGEGNVDAYADLLLEELALDGDARAPGWRVEEVAPGRTFRVAVVGAGMSGLVAAHRLRQAGVEVTVLEKNDDVGGTWLENTYPGCRVDVPNQLYSYSFAAGDWPEHFSSQEHLLAYFRSCADRFGLRSRIRFGTEVLAAELDEADGAWLVTVRRPDGGEEVLEADAVVSAVGQLNRPSLPDIAGLERFEGPAFHSARWDHGVDLAGKAVAVIGTGASAAQLIPELADRVAELVVFQRTPNWFVPTPEYRQPLPDGLRWLFDHVPGYARWYRLWLFWRMHEGLLPAAVVEPDWDGHAGSVGALNDLVRELLTGYLQEQFAGAPELVDAVVPSYPPIAKRVIRDDGAWAGALARDHVALVTDPIERITPRGVVTAGGEEHEVDVIVFGTGFQASRFLTPMQVRGRGGLDLHEHWGGDARAYLGVAVPGFPNLFCLYGPNTNIVINGSIIYFSELGARYVTDCVRTLVEGGHRTMEVRADVHDAFNDAVDTANRAMVWGAAEVNSWYRNEHGRVAQNWPFSLLEYWRRTRDVDLGDYELR